MMFHARSRGNVGAEEKGRNESVRGGFANRRPQLTSSFALRASEDRRASDDRPASVVSVHRHIAAIRAEELSPLLDAAAHNLHLRGIIVSCRAHLNSASANTSRPLYNAP
jgi:hypothetical protein